MSLTIDRAAANLIEAVRARPWGLAVAVIADGKTHIEFDPGQDPLHDGALFQIGSLTKTMTGLLLSQCVLSEEAELSTTVGDLLGVRASKAGDVTLLELATHRSGLPRSPPNLDPARVDPNDPYASYSETDLFESLDQVELVTRGTDVYSNYGYMLLGVLLERITDRRYAELIADRIFKPLGMGVSVCGVPEGGDVVPGYRGATQVPWWQLQLPGPGGVASCIADMAAYVGAMLTPKDGLKAAVEFALAEHAPAPDASGMAWAIREDIHWHNGGTGGFHSFAAFHCPAGTGIVMLANAGDAEMIDGVGFKALQELASSRST
jgi:serine-type D-Ala-D-Ala carboxypeptidase/endopeptidase